MAQILRRKEVSMILIGVTFFIIIGTYFLAVPQLESFSNNLVLMVSVLNAMTILLALYSQTRRSLLFVRQRTHGWFYQLWLIVTLYLMAVVGFVFGNTSSQFMWPQYAIVNPIGSVIYSILAFYMASACARAFRARSIQASLLLISGIIVLMGQAPLTGTFAPFLGTAGTFLTSSFVMAASRVFTISITVGAIVLGVRIITGKESQALGMEGG